MNTTKEVRFDIYCAKCINKDKKETEDPCVDCLTQGWNTDSHKPIYFKEIGETSRSKRRT